LIPLRDTIPSLRFPFVNYAIMALCAVAWLVELGAGAELEPLIRHYGLIPRRVLTLAERAGPFQSALYLPFVSSMFLHGGWMHFAGNMLYLWIFGDNVEDRLGHARYVLFYLLGGVLAGVAHVAASPDSVVPTIGASGAIAAVMGAYFVLYPRARIISLVVLIFWVQVVSIPAFFYLAFWFALQLLSGTLELGGASAAEGGVAWWAHAGGFAFGMSCVWLLLQPRRRDAS
jgi:membrane associated rhomboid family serine protease